MSLVTSLPPGVQLALLRVLPTLRSQRAKYVALLAGGLATVWFIRRVRARKPAVRGRAEASGPRDAGKTRVAVDADFFKRLRRLLHIVIPGWRSKEFALLGLHTGVLLVRTLISLYIATLDGLLVKAIVDRRADDFMLNIAKWLGIAVPACYLNSMIRFLESKLAIAFRTRLSHHVYSRYMEHETYYRVGNLDSRLANPDQCLTEDVNKFSANLAHLHSQISKPVLDLLLIAIQMWLTNARRGKHSDNLPPLILVTTIVFGTVRILRAITPPFGRMVAEQAKREGMLRYVHSRLITHAEEIAFYAGQKIEETQLNERYISLVKHMNTLYRARIIYNAMEGFLMKYVWSATGLVMTAMPLFIGGNSKTKKNEDEDPSARTQYFITSRKLLTDGAEAVERMMSAYKEVTELAGYTYRVDEMLTVFEDMKQEKYKKATVSTEFVAGAGRVTVGDMISLSHVPIVTPNGDVLARDVNLEIRRGMHLLITGPNGCGKSSLFRMCGGLWPVCGGEMVKPARNRIFYIPQRPYLSIGTLRDQIIYPHTVADMKRANVSDADLADIVGWVSLNNVVEREGGWDAVSEWQDVLSGGEKQRIGMARLFYHKPHYAFLDECTSAVSIDVEGKMYQHAIDLGITLLTVTHRPTLWKYHNYMLQFDGEGGYKFTPLNADARLSLKEEKTALESALQGIPAKQSRLRELCTLLGEDSVVLEEVSLAGSRNASFANLADAAAPDS